MMTPVLYKPHAAVGMQTAQGSDIMGMEDAHTLISRLHPAGCGVVCSERQKKKRERKRERGVLSQPPDLTLVYYKHMELV